MATVDRKASGSRAASTAPSPREVTSPTPEQAPTATSVASTDASATRRTVRRTAPAGGWPGSPSLSWDDRILEPPPRTDSTVVLAGIVRADRGGRQSHRDLNLGPRE